MNWSRTVLDGIVMCLIFNITVALLWLIVPNAFSNMLPPEIRKAAPKRERREVVILACGLFFLWIGVLAYSVVSACLAEMTGFWNLFWTTYIEMFFVNLGDFFGLDCLFRSKMKKWIMIPGTENCDAWNTKKWMITLAIPEHWIAWPFFVCPMLGFICAGIGMLIR